MKKTKTIRRYILLFWSIRPNEEPWLMAFKVFKTKWGLKEGYNEEIKSDAHYSFYHLKYTWLCIENKSS